MAAIIVRTTAAAEGCLTHLFSISFDLNILALQQKLTPDYAGRADSVRASPVRLRSELGLLVFAQSVVKSEHEAKCAITQSHGDQHPKTMPRQSQVETIQEWGPIVARIMWPQGE